MAMRNDFAAFILTNNRPDRVLTYETLRRSGYTGRIVLVVDDQDKSIDAYRERYGDQVEVFDKIEAGRITDSGDNFGHLRSVLFARNAAFGVAERIGVKYFIVLDDDYRHFQFRFNKRLDYRPRVCKSLDRVFSAMLDFYIASGCLSLAMAQGGDFIGGDQSSFAKAVRLTRKCMNSFVCSTDRPFKFVARMNDDVSTYVSAAAVGNLMFTTNQLSLEQVQTQTNAGGLTELYLEMGTYVKSFYSVMYHPSGVKVKVLRDRLSARLHHQVSWKNTAPKIISERYRKARA